MKKVSTILALALSMFLPSVALGNQCTGEAGDKVTQIYFSNGVLTELVEANYGSIQLIIAYDRSLEARPDAGQFDFRTAYNDTQGRLTDVLQVLQQKQQELGFESEGLTAYQVFQWVRAGLSVEEIRQAIAVSVGIANRSAVAGMVTDQLLEDLSRTLQESETDATVDMQIVEGAHIGYYEADLQAGKRVFVVAHSQGNLFSNSAVSAVSARNPDLAESIRIVGVASPASLIVPNNVVITAEDDRVINALRLISEVVPATIDNDPGVFGDFRSISNHYFVQDYFDDRLASRDAIDNAIVEFADSVPFPEAIASGGAIRASLTWGAEPDVDLHVFEPDDTHVSYMNKVGTSGFLDVDDVSSYGPENYFVACGDVATGTYSIGVNYYRGFGPEEATISLFLGDGRTIAPRKITLVESRGASGNSTPSILFDIDVTEGSDGNLEYVIR